MKFKPKTVRRLTLLAVAMALVLGVGFSLFVVRRWQADKRTEAHRRNGLAALAAGKHRQAIQDLGRYLQRGRSSDAEVWLALAQARVAIEEPDYTHLQLAAAAYQQYLNLKPDDAEQRMVFLRLCNQTGKYLDARDAAQKLRPELANAGPAHIEVLREEATALAAGKQFDRRLTEVVERLLELAPLDLQGNLIRLEALSHADQDAAARQAAEALARAHPDDPVAQLVGAAALLLRPAQMDVARVKLAHALGLNPATAQPDRQVKYPDSAFVARAVDILDRISAFDLSLSVLLQWNAARSGPPTDRIELALLRTTTRRLWQQGDYQRVSEIVAGVPLESADSEVLAFHALALQRLPETARSDQPEAVQRVLQARTDDYRARSWTSVLPIAAASEPKDPRTDVETLRAAIKTCNRQEPIFEALLGDSLAALSRLDDARQAWKDATESPVAAGWTYPLLRMAETLLAEGRAEEADAPATQALRIAYDSPMVNALWFDVQAARLQRGSTGTLDPRQVLATLERAVEQIERAPQSTDLRAVWERLVPSRVLFLARTGQAPRAVQVARAALDGVQPLSERTLQRLASVSSSERLGFESECLTRAASVNGSSPSIAFAQAIDLAQAGKVDDGLRLLRESAAGGTSAEGRLSMARYLEAVGHASATQSWVALGDEFASDVSIQRACLWSRVVGSNPDFVQRTIDRYRRLSGLEPTAEDPAIRTARARVLLSGTPSAKDRDSAVALLATVVTANPKLVEPKLSLAQALLLANPQRGVIPDPARAITHLTDALAIEPRSTPIALQLATVLQQERDFARARELLIRIASDSKIDIPSRHAAARLLLAQGGDSVPLAIAALNDIDAKAADTRQGSPAAVLADLAEAYVVRREDDKAQAVFARLVAHPSVDGEQLYVAARFYQRTGQSERLRMAVSRLSSASLGPGIKASVLARLAEDRGASEEATQRFEESVTASPRDATLWRHYIGAYLARSRGAEAMLVAMRAMKALPEDTSILILYEQAKLAANQSETADLTPLIAAMSGDPRYAATADVLKSLDEAAQRGDLENADRIKTLADRHPTVPLLQMYLAQRLARLDAARAIELVGRARTLAPEDAAIAKAAAEVFLSLGRWTEMLNAASAWKDLDPKRTSEPDVAIAQARLALHDYKGGLAALKPWIEPALSAPDSPASLPILNMQTRLLIAADREGEARALIEPLLAKSGRVRMAIWLRSAAEAVPTVESARAWIDQVRPMIPAEVMEEQLAVTAAMTTLATRFPDQSKALLADAIAHLEGLTSRAATATGATWEALGVVRHRNGDLTGAEDAYAKALAMEPRRLVSLNNLATILSETKRDLDGALKLARRAVDISADSATLSTLGSIQHAMATRDRKPGNSEAAFKPAAETYAKLAKLRPGDVQAWTKAAQASTDAGDFAGAEAAWLHILNLSGVNPVVAAAARNNLANAILRQDPNRERLERARVLLNEAISAADEPAYRDTLGWVELAAGRRERAIAEFRTALATQDLKKTPLKSAVIGLATALAAGTPSERQEAATLASSVDPRGLDSNLTAKLEKLRALVQVEKP